MNWDLSSFFTEFNGNEMQEFQSKLQDDIRELTKQASGLDALNKDNMEAWSEVFIKSEDITARFSHIASYVGCLTACDAKNEEYQQKEAEMSLIGAEASKFEIEMFRAMKEASDDVFEQFEKRPEFRGIKYFLRRMREESKRTMSREKEILNAELSVDGIHAWGRLYDTISGRMEFEMEYPDGKTETLPMSHRRSLMENPDRKIRKAAFEGGNKAWENMESVAASALNAISGTRLVLNKHRGIEHFLEVALFQAAIKRETLDAMFSAIYENMEVPKRYIKLKAKTMSRDNIAWYDLGAPLDLPDRETFSWEQGREKVRQAFERAYPALGKFAQMEYDKNWVEYEPRAGKRPGAFCTGSLLTKESRVFMTFNGSMGDVLTLAHESGHAFHSHVMREQRPYAHLYPMTLAETASTFAEMILNDGILSDPEIDDSTKAYILDQDIGHAAIYLMDIPVRFEFEKALYEQRSKGELGASKLREMITKTQRNIFGELLEKGGEDPYFWASKLHFYITGVTFYNFPYTFGFLLSRGLYSMFKKEGKDFLPRYEKFLKMTGIADCEEVVRESIGRDITKPDFWAEAIRSLEEPMDRMEKILPEALPDMK